MFETINQFTDHVFDRLENIKANLNKALEESDNSKVFLLQGSESAVFSTVMDFYETVLQTPKLKQQRGYFKYRLKQYNLDFYENYFNDRINKSRLQEVQITIGVQKTN